MGIEETNRLGADLEPGGNETMNRMEQPVSCFVFSSRATFEVLGWKKKPCIRPGNASRGGRKIERGERESARSRIQSRASQRVQVAVTYLSSGFVWNARQTSSSQVLSGLGVAT